MKKTQTNNRSAISKITARVIFVALLMVCISMTSCIWMMGKSQRTFKFDSHTELVDFVERYNSQNDGFVYTFISFDFDNSDNVDVYKYKFETVGELKRSIVTQETQLLDMYDSNHSKGFGFDCEFLFYINEEPSINDETKEEYQIFCTFSTTNDYNFYQNDDMSMEFVESYHISEEDLYFENTMAKYHTCPADWQSQFKMKFANVKTLNKETLDYEEYFQYVYTYCIVINGKEEIKFDIASKTELAQDKIDEIHQILLGNIMIINTEE